MRLTAAASGAEGDRYRSAASADSPRSVEIPLAWLDAKLAAYHPDKVIPPPPVLTLLLEESTRQSSCGWS